MRLIEVCTVNGYRKSIHPQSISCVSELPYKAGKSKAVIDLVNGNTVFVDDMYDSIMVQLQRATEQFEVEQPFHDEQVMNIEPEEEF